MEMAEDWGKTQTEEMSVMLLGSVRQCMGNNETVLEKFPQSYDNTYIDILLIQTLLCRVLLICEITI